MPGDVAFVTGLREFGVSELTEGSVLATCTPELARGWSVALDRARRRPERISGATDCWIRARLAELAGTPQSDEQRARAAEAEAALRLSWLGDVQQVPEGRSATPDFRVEGVNVEVYCPQEHTDERAVMAADLRQQHGNSKGGLSVAIAVGYPVTGSGRRVDSAGGIVRPSGSGPLKFPSNKVIDRILGSKREARQLPPGEINVLWVDLKHGLRLQTDDLLPLRSIVAKGTCFLGSFGVWHAFYGTTESKHLAERATLEWPALATAYQQRKTGWFREMPKVSGAVLSVLDGVALFENPWAAFPFDDATRERFARLSELRPEFSWVGPAERVERDVVSCLAKLDWLTGLTERAGDEDP